MVIFPTGTITSTSITFSPSVDLLIDLLRVGVYGCGTLRSNHKGFPQDLKLLLKKGLSERGEYRVRQHENITVSVWQDNRPVVVISTNSDPTVTTTVQRKMRVQAGVFLALSPSSFTIRSWEGLIVMINSGSTTALG